VCVCLCVFVCMCECVYVCALLCSYVCVRVLSNGYMYESIDKSIDIDIDILYVQI